MENLKKYGLIVTYAIVLFLGVSNLDKVMGTAGTLISVLMPVIVGACIAFVLNLPMTFLEERLLNRAQKKMSKIEKAKRSIALVLTYGGLLLFIVFLITFIAPQVGDSAKTLIDMLPTYARELSNFTVDIYERLGLSNDIWTQIFGNLNDIVVKLSSIAATSVSAIFDATMGITSGVVTMGIAIVFSVYMLASKEKLLGILSKMNRAFNNKKAATFLANTATEAAAIFSKFVGGQITEAFILGGLCCLGMMVFGFPYAPLVGVLIGVTSLIPIVGAFIGTIPAVFIIAMESPIQALLFIVFITVLQQLEGNLIYPKVVGGAIGISGFWVFLAITIGGGLYGITGMLLGVPLMAVVYSLVSRAVNNKLKQTDKKS